MSPPLTLHKDKQPKCAEISKQFDKCRADHPIRKFFGKCTDLKIKHVECLKDEKAKKMMADFSKK